MKRSEPTPDSTSNSPEAKKMAATSGNTEHIVYEVGNITNFLNAHVQDESSKRILADLFVSLYNNVTDLRINNKSQSEVIHSQCQTIAFLSEQLTAKDNDLKKFKAEKMEIDNDSGESVEDRTERLRSVVVAGLAESNKTNANERFDDDCAAVKKLMEETETETSFTSYRMGKSKNGRPRLLKIVFPAKAVKGKFLSGYKQKKDSFNARKISIRPSKTESELKYHRELSDTITELKQKYAIVDWQMLHEGSAMSDLARFLVFCGDGVVRRQAEAMSFEYYFECLKKEFGGDASKVPYSIEQLRKAYNFAFLTQAFFILADLDFFFGPINDRETNESIKSAYYDYGVLKALHAYQDADRLLQGEMKEYFDKYGI